MNSAILFGLPFSPYLLQWQDDAVTRLQTISPHQIDDLSCSASPLVLSVHHQLEEYFSCRRTTFTFPIRCSGTAFQRALWLQVQKIPYGQRVTYGALAAALGRPGAARAVGSALHKNPLWLIVPCHRVIMSSGLSGGYAGGSLMKAFLLNLESNPTIPVSP